MPITAKDVQKLRRSTGAGMMDAKKALTNADGDFEAAVQILREKGLAKAAGRTDRDNSEGRVAVASGDTAVSLVHLKSETDFAAKSDDFLKLTAELVDLVLEKGPDAVSERDAEIESLKLTVKENIELGSIVRYEKTADNVVDAYLHGGGKAGVLVEAVGVDQAAIHEVAMHIAFAKPTFLSRDEVPAEEVERERAALLEITKNEGKPEAAWPKIVEGRLSSWFGERVLLEQGLFGDKEKVSAKIGDGTITRFVLAQVG